MARGSATPARSSRNIPSSSPAKQPKGSRGIGKASPTPARAPAAPAAAPSAPAPAASPMSSNLAGGGLGAMGGMGAGMSPAPAMPSAGGGAAPTFRKGGKVKRTGKKR